MARKTNRPPPPPTHRLPPHAGIFSSDMQVKLRWCESVMRDCCGRRCRSPSVFGVRLSRATERKRPPPPPPPPPPTTAELIKTNAFRTKCHYITTAGKQSCRRKTVNKATKKKTRQLARGTISTRRDVFFSLLSQRGEAADFRTPITPARFGGPTAAVTVSNSAASFCKKEKIL